VIIGLCGLISSGKGTTAEHLMRQHDFIGVSFAETLKDAAACIFGWDRDMLEGSIMEARMAREEKDEWWSERLGFDVSPRSMLQFMGTEVMRGNLHPEIWALATEKRILNFDGPADFVISDVRFPNEIAMIRRLYGKVWHIQRGPLPDWFGKNPEHIHASETAWNMLPVDATLYNNGRIDQLHGTIDVILDNYNKP
jgi:hypothetical protein